MKPFFQLILTGVMVTAYAVPAADSQSLIGVPVLGYVFDPAAQGIRPVSGTPGAALIGSPLDFGVALSWSVISPRQDFAMATGADGAVRILALPPGNFASQILTAAAGVPQKIVFSPSGETAGLYQPGQATIQIFTHLPQDAGLAHEINLAGLTGSLRSAAISDDGNLALILAGDEDDATLWLSYGGGDPVPLPAPPGPSAASFASGSDNAVLATQDGQMYLLENLATGPTRRPITLRDDRLAKPVAVRFTPDGKRVYVATQQGTVAGFGIRSGGATYLSCGCQPSGLFPLHSSTLIRLNEIADGPLMLLDTAQAEPRMWFVPAIAAAGSGGGAQ